MELRLFFTVLLKTTDINEMKGYLPVYRPAFLYGLRENEIAYVSKV